MSNFLDAINNICSNPVTELKQHFSGLNRMNARGKNLEIYIQDVFSNSINEKQNKIRDKNIYDTFSYLGNQNNPPDMMLRSGDAIEVKKIESEGTQLALNSSHPKDKLYRNDTRITEDCRNCEEWEIKDLIYVIGVAPADEKLKHLWLVYGDCYAANESIYKRINNKIKNGIEEIPDVEFHSTNELGRVNSVDPLGITYLRIRGMWGIENPMKVYSNIYSPKKDSKFNLAAIVATDKYNSFPKESKLTIEKNVDIDIADVEIKDPNNPAKRIKSKLITYSL